MKLLMFYATRFWWQPRLKTLPEAGEASGIHEERDCVTDFIHAEGPDGARSGKVVTRAIKQIKWLAGKFDSRRVVLHYFSHLSEDRAPPGEARAMIEAMAARLRGAGYEVLTTPWGWVSQFGLEVVGDSLGRVFGV